MPLPKFSEKIGQALKDGTIINLWSDLIKESPTHFINYGLGSKDVYAAIGVAMITTYPQIAMDSIKPYVSPKQSITNLFTIL